MSKSGKREVCQGCLCSERRLVPLGAHRQLLYRILGEDTRQAKAAVNNLSKAKRSLCWECNQILLNTYKFQQKVLQTQLMLTSYRRRKEDDGTNSSLSTLIVSSMDSYDYIELYKDPFECPIQDVKPENEDNDDENKFEIETLDTLTFDDIESECSDDYFPEDKGKKIEDDIKDEVPDDDTDEDESDDEDDFVGEQNNDIDPGPGESKSVVDSEPPKKIKKVEKKKKSDDEDEDYEPPEFVTRTLGEPKRKPPEKEKTSLPNVKYKRVKCKTENIRTKFSKVPMDRNNYFALLEKYKNSKEYIEAKYKCEKCVIEFFNEEFLKCHLTRHDWDKPTPFKCDICDTYWETDDQLNVHYRNQHMFKLECTLCGEQFLRKRLLFSHQDERHKCLIECLQCGCEFVDLKAFWKHNRDLHTAFTCDYCGETYRSKNGITRHISNRHGTYKCDECSKMFKSLRTLTDHREFQHTKSISERSYCVECDIQFLNEYKYQSHLRTTIAHSNRQPKTKVACPDCGKLFVAHKLKYHYKFEHLKQYDYKCQRCDKNFMSPYHLKKHKQSVHDKVMKRFCEYCGKGFAEMSVLVKHVRTHTGERPFKCEFCSSAFAQKTPMITHTRRVHNIPDYRYTSWSRQTSDAL